MSSKYTILCIVAHPADMVTECGGTLAVHAARGDRVVAVVLTHGGRIHPVVYVEASREGGAGRDAGIAAADRERVIAIKRAEMDAAAEILGIDEVITLDHDDNMGVVKESIIHQVADAMCEVRPTMMIAHHPGYHTAVGNDHCLAGRIAVAAAGRAAHQLSNLDAGADAHFVKQTFFFGAGVSARSALFPGGGPINDVYIDIGSVVEKKIRAMDQFVSQGYAGNYARKCVMGHNGHWGSIGGVTYAEPFIRSGGEVFDFLPLSERVEKRDEHTMHRDYSEGVNPWDVPVEPSPSTEMMASGEE